MYYVSMFNVYKNVISLMSNVILESSIIYILIHNFLFFIDQIFEIYIYSNNLIGYGIVHVIITLILIIVVHLRF